jgi:hypothetical protein
MDDFMESLCTDGIDPETGEILDEEIVEVDDPDDETGDQDDEDAGKEPPALLYPDLATWVEDFLSMIYERPTISGRRTWCPQWWAHAEAVYRLQSLWLSWEHMRVNDGPVGAATWLVNYADPIMNVLFDPEGPFNGCTLERGHSEERPHEDGRLPCWPAPEGLFEPRQ